MPWLYNLITLVIVLVFFFIYHRITANNRSLDKVRKLAERLQGELGAYVETRSEELKHYGIDLDVQQKAAKIALEKLQASQATLAEKSEAIGAIAERFKEYDDVLAKLMAMTARVDENLARVHDEASFAEGVNRKLDLSRKALAAVERDLPLLRENFALDARKTLDGFRDGILDELKGGLEATEAELRAVREESLAAFEKARGARALVDAELEKALQTAAERAASVEDQAFSTLREASETKLAGFEEALGEKLALAGGEAADKLGGMKESLDAFRKEWESETQAMLGEMRSRLEEADSIFARKATEIATLLGDSRDKAEEAGIGLSKTAQEARASLDQSLGRITDTEASIQQSLETTKTRIEEDFAAFGQAFEERRTSFEENFVAETKALAESLASLKSEVAELKNSAYTSAEAKLAGFEDGLLASLSARKAEAFKKLDGWLSEMEKTLSGITAEASARRESEENRKLEESRAHLVKVRDELHAQIDRMGRDIESLKESILEQDREARKLLDELAPTFEEKARTLFGEAIDRARNEPSAGEEGSPRG